MRHRPYIIGVTGSVGKSTASTIITQTLQQSFPTLRIHSSILNGELWLSLSILQINTFGPTIRHHLKGLWVALQSLFVHTKPYDIIVLEYGIDHIGEMDFLLSIAVPDIGLVTQIDAVHSMQFGDAATIWNEKSKLLMAAKSLVFTNRNCSMSQLGATVADQIVFGTLPFTFTAHNHITYAPPHIDQESDWSLVSEVAVQINDLAYSVRSNLFESQNYGYLSVALTIRDVVMYQFLQQSPASWLLSFHYTLPRGRYQLLWGLHDHIIVDSSYNASPGSVRQTILNTVELWLHSYPHYGLTLCLWDMRELGEATEQYHREMARRIIDSSLKYSWKLDHVYVVGQWMHDAFGDERKNYGWPDIVQYFEHSVALRRYLGSDWSVWSPQMIIFKWSQNTIFLEEAIKCILSNPEDVTQLVRQSERRITKKQSEFHLPISPWNTPPNH